VTPKLERAKKVPVPVVETRESAVPNPNQFNVFPNCVVRVAFDAPELIGVDAKAVAISGLSF
jgi:hypothetical protein